MALTEVQIKNLNVEKTTRIPDREGLYLQVIPSGKKTWMLRYQADGKRHWMSLGKYGVAPGELSLKDARASAAAKMAALRDKESSVDPLAKRVADRVNAEAARVAAEQVAANARTMNELFAMWDEEYGPTIDGHHREGRRSLWRCHIGPAIGAKTIPDADKKSLLECHGGLVKADKVTTATKMFAFARQVLKWGAQRGMVDDTHPILLMAPPIVQVQVREDQRPENFSIDDFLARHGDEAIGSEDEDGLAGRALRFDELTLLLGNRLRTSTQPVSGKCIIRFMLATGLRSAETTRLRWAWINLDKQLLILPGGSMKKRRMHHVHLSDYALAQLAIMAEQKSGAFVFPAAIRQEDRSRKTASAGDDTAEGKHIRRDTVSADIRRRQFYPSSPDAAESERAALIAQLKKQRHGVAEIETYNLPGGHWSLYDMRRTAATRLQELGYELDTVRRILAHAAPESGVTALYARFGQWAQRCKALDDLGAALARCEVGPSVETPQGSRASLA